MPPPEIEELMSKRICSDCVREEFLSGLIAKDGFVAECDYCGDDTAATWSVKDLADAVEAAFNAHMLHTPENPPETERALYADKELNLTWYRAGQETADAIEDRASIPSEAARDAQAILEDRHNDVDLARMGAETAFAADACYEEMPTDATEWHWAWATFEHALLTEARFFNEAGAGLLTRVFGDIDRLRSLPRHPVVVTAGPGHRINHLYRARVFQADAKLEEAIGRPDLHVGSPPARFANAGRMNAKGISVFYGATSDAVALAEVRPPVGSKVAVAKFDIVRPLRLLDLTALAHARDYGSIFDPTLKDRLGRVAFLQTLGERMTRPVMPGDEAFDYLTTQAIADFLSTVNKPRLDGIIFASAQAKGGRNVVLFHAAARVEEMALPPGTEVSVSVRYADEEGSTPDYLVFEEVPAIAPDPDDDEEAMFRSWLVLGVGDEVRKPALKVDPTSVNVHHIEWVQVRSTSFEARRRRIDK